MGFKDKVRNNQNAEHATIEDYQKSIQEKYAAERANRGKPIVAIEVPMPVVVEPIEQPIKAEQVEKAPAFVKSRDFEPVEQKLEEESSLPEEKSIEPEEKKIEIEKASKPIKPEVKSVKKNTKFKKKDPTNP